MSIYEPNVALVLAERRSAELRADAERFRLVRRGRKSRRASGRGGKS